MTGGTVVIMRKFNAEQALRLIEKWRIQSAFMPPILLKRTLDLPDAVRRKYDTSSLRNISVSGAPCPIPVGRPPILSPHTRTHTSLCPVPTTHRTHRPASTTLSAGQGGHGARLRQRALRVLRQQRDGHQHLLAARGCQAPPAAGLCTRTDAVDGAVLNPSACPPARRSRRVWRL